MECLPPTVSCHIFMDNYFTSFCLLTHLGVNNIQATGVLNNALETNSYKKKAVQLWQWLVTTTTGRGCIAFSIFMTRIWVLLREWTGMWPSTGLVSERINSRGPCLLEWFMLFFRMRGCIVLTKMNALSLCLF